MKRTIAAGDYGILKALGLKPSETKSPDIAPQAHPLLPFLFYPCAFSQKSGHNFSNFCMALPRWERLFFTSGSSSAT